ncbi:MAG: T9SS type A sorting domain-containing protein, partial [Flammeovirgaceae bacterium]
NPADIVYGTALSATQLNAESSVGGSFVYTPTIGSELDAGVGQQLFVAFTPNDTQNYLTKTAQVTINITQAPQTIMFTALADKTYGDIPFELSGTSSSGLPLVYVSSDPTVALVDGSRVTIVGAGTTVINASQPGDTNYQPVAAQQMLTVNKANQTISFAPLPTVLVNSPAFALTAAASSSLPIAYSTTSNNITLTNGSVGIIGAGRATITVTQSGSSNYNAAEPVSQSFCINPAKPSIAISNLNTPSPLLTSSAPEGNQWYLDGVAIAGATGATYMATKSGSYQVRVTIDGCTGEFADEQPVVITGVETALPLVEVYPNPVTNGVLTISFGGIGGEKQVTIFALTGETILFNSTESGSIELDVANLTAGMYLAKVIADGTVHTKKFKK